MLSIRSQGLERFVGVIGPDVASREEEDLRLEAVRVLGVSRAVLFPAMVPAVSILIGIPIVGEIPGTLQIAGLALVTAGLLVTIGVLDRLRTAMRRR